MSVVPTMSADSQRNCVPRSELFREVEGDGANKEELERP